MQEVTNAFIRTLAAANGIEIPDERLELVRRQYDSLMRNLARINTLAIPRETEPALVHPIAGPSDRRIEGGR